MKYYWLLFFVVSFSYCDSQTDSVLQEIPLIYSEFRKPKKPQVYYFPFYNDVQIIEIDYYNYNLALGSWEDVVHPRGGSSFDDALRMDFSNGYILRNSNGEILTEYNLNPKIKLKLSPIHKTTTITHAERFEQFEMVASSHFATPKFKKKLELFGPNYIVGVINHAVAKGRIGIIDTLGILKIDTIYTHVKYISPYYIATSSMNDITIFNNSFDTIVSNIKGYEVLKNNQLLVLKEKWGCINVEGGLVLPFIYDYYHATKKEQIDLFIGNKVKFRLKQ